MTYRGYEEKDFFAIRRELEIDQAIVIDRTLTDLRGVPPREPDEISLHLALITRHSLFYRSLQTRTPSYGLRDNHARIFEPVLPSSLMSIDRTVSDVGPMKDHRWQGIAAIIDDSDGRLAEERNTYYRRIGPVVEKMEKFRPHIKLISTNTRTIDPSAFDTLVNVVPKTISLRPVSTLTPDHLPHSMQEALGLRPQEQDVTEKAPLVPRIIGAIPESLIKSLRHDDDSKEGS